MNPAMLQALLSLFGVGGGAGGMLPEQRSAGLAAVPQAAPKPQPAPQQQALGLAAVPPAPTPPQQPAFPSSLPTATQPSMWDDAYKQSLGMQQKAQERFGFDIKNHPIKSILNLIAGLGQGFASGYHHQPSPFTEQANAVNSPDYALHLAHQIMSGQNAGVGNQFKGMELLNEEQRIKLSKDRLGLEQQAAGPEMEHKKAQTGLANARTGEIAANQEYRQKLLALKQQTHGMNANDRVAKLKEFIAMFGDPTGEIAQEIGIAEEQAGRQPVASPAVRRYNPTTGMIE